MFFVSLLMKQHFQMELCFLPKGFILTENDGVHKALVLSFLVSANQNPASCHPMSLFSRLNILPPFVANAKSISLSIRCKHNIWRGGLFEVWSIVPFFYLHLASAP